MLNILDEFSRECLSIRVKRRLRSDDVIDALADLFILRGVPAYIRSDNGPEFIATALRQWLKDLKVQLTSSREALGKTDTSKASMPRLRDELLNGEIFYILEEAKAVIETWRCHYNTVRPHSALRYQPPAPLSVLWPPLQPQPAATARALASNTVLN